MYMSKFDHSGTLRGPLAFFENETSGNARAEESDASLTTKANFRRLHFLKKRQSLLTIFRRFWRRLGQNVGRGHPWVSCHQFCDKFVTNYFYFGVKFSVSQDGAKLNFITCRDLNVGDADTERRMRREIANSNERRRMQSINAGFQSLRTLLPHHEGEKLSKVNDRKSVIFDTTDDVLMANSS